MLKAFTVIILGIFSLIPFMNIGVVIGLLFWWIFEQNVQGKHFVKKLLIFCGLFFVISYSACYATLKYLRELGKEETFVFKDQLPKNKTAQAEFHLKRLHTAMKMYYTKNLCYPDKLEELAPEFIENVPNDPATVRAFIYKIAGTDKFTISVPLPGGYGLTAFFIDEERNITKK